MMEYLRPYLYPHRAKGSDTAKSTTRYDDRINSQQGVAKEDGFSSIIAASRVIYSDASTRES